jgi:TPR repeat protein
LRKCYQIIFVITIPIAIISLSIAGELDDDLGPFSSEIQTNAYHLWAHHSKEGDASAQVNLGAMYAFGKGVPLDYKEAVKWYRLAAEQGDAIAQCYLGSHYASGQGVPQDDQKAAKGYLMSAKLGVDKGQLNLGIIYDEGRGVSKKLCSSQSLA